METETIRLARQDVTDRAAEYERAHKVLTVAGDKLRAAQDRLAALLRELYNAKS